MRCSVCLGTRKVIYRPDLGIKRPISNILNSDRLHIERPCPECKGGYYEETRLSEKAGDLVASGRLPRAQ